MLQVTQNARLAFPLSSLGALHETSLATSRHKKPRCCGDPLRAQLRTRTGDPFLTMEVLYQLS
jgi:hypothetical protein